MFLVFTCVLSLELVGDQIMMLALLVPPSLETSIMPAQGMREGDFPVQAHPAAMETPAWENHFNTASSLHCSHP